MPVKHYVLLTSALIVLALVLRSQGVSSDDASGQAAAALFTAAPIDLGRATDAATPSAATPQRGASDAKTRAENRPSPEPWALTLPKSPSADQQAGPAKEIDISALRYFASQNDLGRVTAEIRLLRSKYPGWEPPQDLFSGPQNPELEKPMWDMFAKGDYAGARAAIADARQNNPDWQPSADLMGKLTLAEAYRDLESASNAKQWDKVVNIAAANKMLLTCSYVDALWRTAEALVHSDDREQAVEAYRYILTSCGNAHERLATIQKASQLLDSSDDLDSLLQLGKRLASGKSEFESIRYDQIRRKIGDAAAHKLGAMADQTDVDALGAHARAANDRDDQKLLGWYAYSHRDYAQAEQWFTMALQQTPDAKAAEGLVLTLRDSGKFEDARRSALQYASLDPLNRKLMTEVVAAFLSYPNSAALSPDDLATFTQAVDEEKSADAAQIYAWRLYNANDVAGAESWFRKSAEWAPNEPAALGLVVSTRRLKQAREYREFVAKYRPEYPKVAQFDDAMSHNQRQAGNAAHSAASRHQVATSTESGWDKNADAIVKSLQSGDYKGTLAMLDERRQQDRPEFGGLVIVRAWAQYHTGDWDGAKRSFVEAEAKGQGEAAKEGLGYVERGYLPPWLR